MSESKSDSDNQTQPSAGNAETGVVKYDGPKHTPGPWQLTPGDSVIQVKATNGKDIAVVASVPYWKRFSETDSANAHLIAAAPDMLAALKALVGEDSASAGMRFSERIALARAALSKAEPTS